MKDVSLARALFDQKLTHSVSLSASAKIHILLENANFEELQSNIPRARKIHEQLEQEIAPGLIKVEVARINFEKRQGSVEKAKELYFKAFKSSMDKEDSMAVTFIATQYCRFLLKQKEEQRALDILQQAISSPKVANKVLFLTYINLTRSRLQPDTTSQVKSIFEKAIDLLKDQPARSDDLKDLCIHYVNFLEEEANDLGGIKELKSTKDRLKKLGLPIDAAEGTTALARVKKAIQ